MGMIAFGALFLWFLLVNAASFFLMWLDRRRAQRGDWRIQERTLQMVFLIGGAIGGKFAQRRLRHKTRKRPFIHVLDVLLAWNVLAYGYLAVQTGPALI